MLPQGERCTKREQNKENSVNETISLFQIASFAVVNKLTQCFGAQVLESRAPGAPRCFSQLKYQTRLTLAAAVWPLGRTSKSAIQTGSDKQQSIWHNKGLCRVDWRHERRNQWEIGHVIWSAKQINIFKAPVEEVIPFKISTPTVIGIAKTHHPKPNHCRQNSYSDKILSDTNIMLLFPMSTLRTLVNQTSIYVQGSAHPKRANQCFIYCFHLEWLSH